MRGKHTNRPRQAPEAVRYVIAEHIKTFKARGSHYSLASNRNRLYLPETLSVSKMHGMFLQEYRINVPYSLYYHLFCTMFNLKFGPPRSDTCSTCDALSTKMKATSSAVDLSALEQEH